MEKGEGKIKKCLGKKEKKRRKKKKKKKEND